MSDPLGKRYIAALIHAKDAAALDKMPIDELLDDARRAGLWVKEYRTKHGEIPTLSMISESTSITFSSEIDPVPYIVDQLRKRTLSIQMERGLKRAAEFLESRDPDAALDVVRKIKDTVKVEGVTPTSYRMSGESRLDRYRLMKELGGYSGVPTPWKSLNAQIQGWVDGTLNVVTAMQNTGKTWFVVINSDFAYSLGKKVLLVTLEMPEDKIARRLDALRYKLPFGGLRDGSLDDLSVGRWKESLISDAAMMAGDVIIADKKLVRTVSDVMSLVNSCKPDIVFIDGGYRFEGDRKSNWESTSAIVAELQISAELTNIPWVVTTQQGDASETGKEKKRGPKMHAWGVRYGKEWVINPDNVIGLFQGNDLRLLRQSEIYVLKIRESAGSSESLKNDFRINWDLRDMNFTELFPEDEGGPTTVDDAPSDISVTF